MKASCLENKAYWSLKVPMAAYAGARDSLSWSSPGFTVDVADYSGPRLTGSCRQTTQSKRYAEEWSRLILAPGKCRPNRRPFGASSPRNVKGA